MFSLIFAIAGSVSKAVGKQLESMALVMIRDCFTDIGLNENYADYLEEYYDWAIRQDTMVVLPTYLKIESERVTPPTATPEPGTVLLMGVGLAGLAF